MSTTMYYAPRGTRDFGPREMAVRNHVGGVLRRTFESFGYREIQTPVFESFELFAARAGEEIRESMFTFASDAGRYALRPELTSPVCRMVTAGGLGDDPPPHKLFYSGPCFRYCRPEPGRHREFVQAGVELLGAPDPLADAEVIALAVRTLDRLGIPLSELRLRVGNVGIFRSLVAECVEEDRELVVEDDVLHDIDHLVHLGEVCDEVTGRGSVTEADAAFLNVQWRLVQQIQKQAVYDGEHALGRDTAPPMGDDWLAAAATLPDVAEATYRHAWQREQRLPDEVADRLLKAAAVRGPVDGALSAAAELVAGTPAQGAYERLQSVCDWLAKFGVTEFNVVLGTVRNLDFYTGTVFEIDAPVLGERSQVCGGGRYDRLVEEFGGPAMPATGFAFGFDRLVDVVTRRDPELTRRAAVGLDAYVAAANADSLITAVSVADQLRRHADLKDVRIANDLVPADGDPRQHARGQGAAFIVVADAAHADTCEAHRVSANGLESLGRLTVDDIARVLRPESS